MFIKTWAAIERRRSRGTSSSAEASPGAQDVDERRAEPSARILAWTVGKVWGHQGRSATSPVPTGHPAA
eukprot:6296595-Lingulodinium_polyedra.AAC.1